VSASDAREPDVVALPSERYDAASEAGASPPGDRAGVSVIVPVYGAAPLALRAVRAIEAGGGAAEVLLVDDASPDAAAEVLEQAGTGARVIRRPRNGGFAAACATGWAAADPSHPWVAVLNSDAVPEPGWLEACVAELERDPSLGSAAPQVVASEDPGRLDSAGLVWTIAGWAGRRGHGEPRRPADAPIEPILGPTGCAAVMRRAALEDAGGFFEVSYESYYEDLELALRLRRRGWGSVLVPAAVVRHDVGASFAARAARKQRLVARNATRVLIEHVPAPLAPLAVVHHALLTGLVVGRAVRRGGLGPVLRGRLAALGGIASSLARRCRRPADRASIEPWIERRWLPLVRAAAGRETGSRPARFGRYVYMVGGNREAAEYAGVNVKLILAAVLVIGAVCAGVAAGTTPRPPPPSGDRRDRAVPVAAPFGGPTESRRP